MQLKPARMHIIATSPDSVRLRCDICGSHRVVERRRLGPAIRCSTCDAPRTVEERRTRDLGHTPERRVLLPSV